MSKNPHPFFGDDLRLENEILKMKIQAEYGALVYAEPGLPPEVEAEFLSHVYAYEQAWQHVKMMPVYDLLHQPSYKPERTLSDRALIAELDRLMHLLKSHQISIDIPGGTTPREVYRYVTEFLFRQEVDDLKIEGLERHFFYSNDFTVNC